MLRLRLILATLSLAAFLFVPPRVNAAKDLLDGLPIGRRPGVEFGWGEGGYRMFFEYFEGPDQYRTHVRIVQVEQQPKKQTMKASVNMRRYTGFSGDGALLFGAGSQGYYYVVVSETLMGRQWTIGHWRNEYQDYEAIAGGPSFSIYPMDEGNDVEVEIQRRPADKPLITVWINGDKMAEVSALHDENHPVFSPFGNVGVLGTIYQAMGQNGYYFSDLFVEFE